MKNLFAKVIVITLCMQAMPAFSEMVKVDDVRWRAPIPGQTVGAVYLSLTNTGSSDRVFTGIQVDWAKKAEFHEHRHSNGMMQMRKVEQLVVPAQQTLNLVPGGFHIMVFGVSGDIDSTPLELELIDEDETVINVVIEK